MKTLLDKNGTTPAHFRSVDDWTLSMPVIPSSNSIYFILSAFDDDIWVVRVYIGAILIDDGK